METKILSRTVIPGLIRDLPIKNRDQHSADIYEIPGQARDDSFEMKYQVK
ncbi:MAG: hypothetical protein JWP12_850 [Bacteroidetes bacterium]|nr:hypothetical protein [Bacteroidota bacterium]